MTKAKTIGQKRRGRPRKEGPRDPVTQRLSRISPERREANQQAAIVARCRALGWLPRIGEDGKPTMKPTAEMAKRATSEWMGCNAGRAIDMEKDRAELWGAIKAIRATYVRYWAAIGAPPPYAKSAMLAYLPEVMGSEGVDASGWDDRPEEERVKVASAAMMRVEQTIGMAGEGVLAEVKAAVLLDADVRCRCRLIMGLRAIIKRPEKSPCA